MADTDTKAIADFYAGLSPEDATACLLDILLYGEAFARKGHDGVYRRIPALDFQQDAVLDPGPWWRDDR